MMTLPFSLFVCFKVSDLELEVEVGQISSTRVKEKAICTAHLPS